MNLFIISLLKEEISFLTKRDEKKLLTTCGSCSQTGRPFALQMDLRISHKRPFSNTIWAMLIQRFYNILFMRGSPDMRGSPEIFR